MGGGVGDGGEGGGGDVNEDVLELDVAVDDPVFVEVADGGDELGEHALDHGRGEDFALGAGELEEVAARAVGEDEQGAGFLVFAGFEVDEGRVGDALQHLHFSPQAGVDAFFVGASCGAVLDDFHGDHAGGIQ